MKKIALLLISISIFLNLHATNIEEVYSFSNPIVSSHDGYQTINFKSCMLTSPTGEPMLPYYAVKLLLPPGQEAVDIQFVGEDEVILEGSYQIFPSQVSRPISQGVDGKFYKNKDIYTSANLYPENQVGSISTSYLNGYALAMSTFTPVVYNPLSGKISYYSKVRIVVTTKSSDKSVAALANLSNRENNMNRVEKFVQNKSSIKSYSSLKNRSEDSYEYLIITTTDYENEFDELQDIYLSRGLRSKVFTKQYITQNISGQDVPEKIRNFIIQEYQQSDIEYVLIGGDVEKIPYRGFYCYVVSGDGYSDYGIPADLYYSALDGNWNDNGDEKWGEPDEDDLLPEIAVARFPFSNQAELDNLLNKTISYQNSPVLGEFQKPFLAGENLYSGPDTWGKDYLDLLIGEHSDNGYTTSGFPDTYNYETMYEFDAPWSGSDLMNKVNEGKQFVHHVGHANTTYVAHMNIGDITDANFYGANGTDHNFTIMETHGCDCGGFDANDCILEKMVNIQNFAAAVIGNSRYGWFNEGQTEGPSEHLHREMIDAMFGGEIAQIGKAFVESKIQTAPWVEAPGQWEDGALRWNFYDINVLGDPGMSVWSDEPISIEVDYPSEIAIGTTSVDVIVTQGGFPLPDFSCTILKDGELRSMGTTDANGLANMVFDPVVSEVGEASLIVSGYNCLPDTNEIMFIADGQPYVVYYDNNVDDSNGNSNGQIDCGESIMLDLSLENIGAIDAVGVNALISTDSEWIALSDSSDDYGNIAISEIKMNLQAFSFDVANNIPDQTSLNFDLEATSDTNTWLSSFSLLANAPNLVSANMIVDDSQSGNNNDNLDPGETALLQIVVSNEGHDGCLDANSILSSNSDYVVIDIATVEMGDLDTTENFICNYNVTVDASAPTGTQVVFGLDMNTGAYQFTNQYFQTIGMLMEDFETGDFSLFDWINTGDMPWLITDVEPFDGIYSAQSGEISDGESSDLMIQLEVMTNDEITFNRKVSSEQDWDFLKFYIDAELQQEWSGELAWEEFSFPITSGTHILKWTYAKDTYDSAGDDMALLDNIIFPAAATILGVSNEIGSTDISVFPNPSKGIVYLDMSSSIDVNQISVYDLSGRKIFFEISGNNNGDLKIKLGNITSGIYLLEVSALNGKTVKKIVVD